MHHTDPEGATTGRLKSQIKCPTSINLNPQPVSRRSKPIAETDWAQHRTARWAAKGHWEKNRCNEVELESKSSRSIEFDIGCGKDQMDEPLVIR